jgi:hypothetical protein
MMVVIKGADQKPLTQVAVETKGLISRARQGKVHPGVGLLIGPGSIGVVTEYAGLNNAIYLVAGLLAIHQGCFSGAVLPQ